MVGDLIAPEVPFTGLTHGLLRASCARPYGRSQHVVDHDALSQPQALDAIDAIALPHSPKCTAGLEYVPTEAPQDGQPSTREVDAAEKTADVVNGAEKTADVVNGAPVEADVAAGNGTMVDMRVQQTVRDNVDLVST